MEVKQVQISDSLEGIARVGALFLKQVSNGPVSSELRAKIDALAEELQASMQGRKLSDIESVTRIRKLYRLIGIDPTKDRPSSEKLLRRVVRGKAIPKIGKLVDALNYVSLRNGCPMSAYDWDTIVPPVLVRIGQPGEGYYGISSASPSTEDGATEDGATEDGAIEDGATEDGATDDEEESRNWVNVHGRLTLVDGEGPFGNPTHDSARTQVQLGSVRALIIAWVPAETPRKFLESLLEETAEICAEFCDARVTSSAIL